MAAKQRWYWICQIVAWMAYAVFNVLLINLYQRLPLWSSLSFLSYGLAGILCSHGLRFYFRRVGMLQRPWADQVWMGLAGVLGAGLALTVCLGLLWWLIHPPSFFVQGLQVGTLLMTLFNMSFLMALWTVIYVVVHLIWRQLDLKQAQLESLQAQVNPHFLFNSLNSLRGLLREDADQAELVLNRLAALMRYSLSQTREPVVTLATELAMVRDYVAIEQVRFEERLGVDWSVSAVCEATPVPPMGVQTLVENAIKHGTSKLTSGGRIGIAADVDGAFTVVRVCNPGVLCESGEPGTGLANLRQRLDLQLGREARLELRQEAGRVVAELRLPRVGT